MDTTPGNTQLLSPAMRQRTTSKLYQAQIDPEDQTLLATSTEAISPETEQALDPLEFKIT
jgi:hypothetical protein